MPGHITIRRETPKDYETVERLTYRAFVNNQVPPRDYCDEHYLVHRMREIPEFIPELDFVAELDGTLAGNIVYTKSEVLWGNGTKVETITFGPLSVLPEYQKMGVGSALVRHTLGEAKRFGYRAVIIFGHPEYYPRFGFRDAGEFGVTTADGKNFSAFMAYELYEGALDGVNGKFRDNPVFRLPKEEVDTFNRENGYE